MTQNNTLWKLILLPWDWSGKKFSQTRIATNLIRPEGNLGKKRLELVERKAERNVTQTEKWDVDKGLSDLGNRPIFNNFVEWVPNFSLEHEFLLSLLVSQAQSGKKKDFFRVLARDSSLLFPQRPSEENTAADSDRTF